MWCMKRYAVEVTVFIDLPDEPLLMLVLKGIGCSITLQRCLDHAFFSIFGGGDSGPQLVVFRTSHHPT